MKSDHDLMPCPLCYSTKVNVRHHISSANKYFVRCNSCGTRGPISTISSDGAARYWNARPSGAAPEVPDREYGPSLIVTGALLSALSDTHGERRIDAQVLNRILFLLSEIEEGYRELPKPPADSLKTVDRAAESL